MEAGCIFHQFSMFILLVSSGVSSRAADLLYRLCSQNNQSFWEWSMNEQKSLGIATELQTPTITLIVQDILGLINVIGELIAQLIDN